MIKIHTFYVEEKPYFTYIRISELEEWEKAPFSKWLYGQTLPLIPNLEPQDATYSWDYERWVEYRKTGKEVFD